ncbi:MAG: DNA-deoxyinosine glycosylase [Gammaproteobacteria bacterium]|nr:DNA-deoxyinosine glycosylase [Gammaproteobacteria bacterium]
MNPIVGFAPIADAQARILILGSMPGVESLAQHQYYAHPRNSFWYIMARILGVDETLSYAQKTQTLRAHRIALWDVLNSCIREGSLDTAIDSGSIIVNDFAQFFVAHAHITHVFFNGQKAAQEYRKRVMPTLTAHAAGLHYVTLPSTSPAMASLHRDKKLDAWRQALRVNY